MFEKNEILSNFKTDRYEVLNKIRWEQFLTMGISLKGLTVFEPGAGIGDQTEWLLEQGVRSIIVNDGREENIQLIQERFKDDPRVTTILENMEEWENPVFDFDVQFIYCYGMYYHINDPAFDVLFRFSQIGEAMALEYLEGDDTVAGYGYDNPSTSLSRNGIRPTTATMVKAMKESWVFTYLPKVQLDWDDPCAQGTPRRIIVGSNYPMENPNLIAQ